MAKWYMAQPKSKKFWTDIFTRFDIEFPFFQRLGLVNGIPILEVSNI